MAVLKIIFVFLLIEYKEKLANGEISKEYDDYNYIDQIEEKTEINSMYSDNELTHVRTKNLSGNVKLTTLQVLTTNTPLDKLNNDYENEEQGTLSENKQDKVKTNPENQDNVGILSEIGTKAPTDGNVSLGLMDVFSSTSGTLPDQAGTEKLITVKPLNFKFDDYSTRIINFDEFVSGNERNERFGATTISDTDSTFEEKMKPEVWKTTIDNVNNDIVLPAVPENDKLTERSYSFGETSTDSVEENNSYGSKINMISHEHKYLVNNTKTNDYEENAETSTFATTLNLNNSIEDVSAFIEVDEELLDKISEEVELEESSEDMSAIFNKYEKRNFKEFSISEETRKTTFTEFFDNKLVREETDSATDSTNSQIVTITESIFNEEIESSTLDIITHKLITEEAETTSLITSTSPQSVTVTDQNIDEEIPSMTFDIITNKVIREEAETMSTSTMKNPRILTVTENIPNEENKISVFDRITNKFITTSSQVVTVTQNFDNEESDVISEQLITEKVDTIFTPTDPQIVIDTEKDVNGETEDLVLNKTSDKFVTAEAETKSTDAKFTVTENIINEDTDNLTFDATLEELDTETFSTTTSTTSQIVEVTERNTNQEIEISTFDALITEEIKTTSTTNTQEEQEITTHTLSTEKFTKIVSSPKIITVTEKNFDKETESLTFDETTDKLTQEETTTFVTTMSTAPQILIVTEKDVIEETKSFTFDEATTSTASQNDIVTKKDINQETDSLTFDKTINKLVLDEATTSVTTTSTASQTDIVTENDVKEETERLTFDETSDKLGLEEATTSVTTTSTASQTDIVTENDVKEETESLTFDKTSDKLALKEATTFVTTTIAPQIVVTTKNVNEENENTIFDITTNKLILEETKTTLTTTSTDFQVVPVTENIANTERELTTFDIFKITTGDNNETKAKSDQVVSFEKNTDKNLESVEKNNKTKKKFTDFATLENKKTFDKNVLSTFMNSKETTKAPFINSYSNEDPTTVNVQNFSHQKNDKISTEAFGIFTNMNESISVKKPMEVSKEFTKIMDREHESILTNSTTIEPQFLEDTTSTNEYNTIPEEQSKDKEHKSKADTSKWTKEIFSKSMKTLTDSSFQKEKQKTINLNRPKIETIVDSLINTPADQARLINITEEEPTISAEINRKIFRFTVKITINETTFFIPSDAVITHFPHTINITWRSSTPNLNNSLQLNLGNSVQLNVVKDSQMHTYTSLLPPENSYKLNVHTRLITVNDGIQIYFSDTSFMRTHHEIPINTDALFQSKVLLAEIVGGCVGFLVICAVFIYCCIKRVKGKRRDFKGNVDV